jgi:hypothetical protein
MTGDRATGTNDPRGKVPVGILLVVTTGIYVAGLLMGLLGTFMRYLTSPYPIVAPNQVNEAIIMLFAGGMGSSVYAIRAFWIHVCEKKDWDRAYWSWYSLRSIQGALMALIFHFVIRGGLLLVTINGESKTVGDLNTWSLAGVGALVGLFSRYALEKLRQVFMIIFTSKVDLDRQETEEKLQADIGRKKLETELEQAETGRIQAEARRKSLEKEAK